MNITEEEIEHNYKRVLSYHITEENFINDVKNFIILCNKNQILNKNKDINISLTEFKDFLNIFNKFSNQKDKYKYFYVKLFIKFLNKVKEIYYNNFIIKNTPISINKTTINLGELLKETYINKNKTFYYSQFNYMINNYNIFTNEEKNELLNWSKKRKEEDDKKNYISFNNYYDKIINFNIDLSLDIVEQYEYFYMLCENANNTNKLQQNSNFNINDEINEIIDILISYYYYTSLKSYKDILLYTFSKNIIIETIKEIQDNYKYSKYIDNFKINKYNINFTDIIKKFCVDTYNIKKYKKIILQFILDCEGSDGWTEKNKKILYNWVNI